MTAEAEGGIWVIIPVYNEAHSLKGVLSDLHELNVTTVVVDDCSTDDSVRVANRFANWVIRHSLNLGQGAALQTGISFALARGASFLVTFDADGQHDARDVELLVAALHREKVDFALGSRFLGNTSGMPFTRKMTLKLAIIFTRFMSSLRVTDTHNGLRAMTRNGASFLRLKLNRMEHASEILDQIADSRLRYVEVPVNVRYTPETLAKGQRSTEAFRIVAKLLAEKIH